MSIIEGLAMDVFWRYALAAIPVAAIVAVVTRWMPCRPSTRHALWLTVLLWLVVAPMLPTVPTLTASRAGIVASNDDSDLRRFRPPIFVNESTPSASRRSVARPRLDGGSDSPTRLAQATDVDGPLTFSSDIVQDGISSYALPKASPLPHGSWPLDSAPLLSTLHTNARSAPVDLNDPVDTSRGDWRAWVIGMFAVRDAFGELPPFPTSLWLGGAAILALLVVAKTWFFMRLLGGAQPASPEVRRLVAKCGKKIGLRRLPETFMVKNRLSPMILAGRRLRLILPESLWNELDDDCRRAVVLHELAHVRRRDHWVAWADVIVGALYWWYPLVWFVRGRVRAEAEHCCDAWVTSLIPSGRRAYAEALLKTKQYIREEKQWVPTTGIGMARGRAERFARRITMVMTKTSKPGISAPGVALVLMIATASWVATPAQSCPPSADDSNAPKLVGRIVPAIPSAVAAAPSAVVVGVPAISAVPAITPMAAAIAPMAAVLSLPTAFTPTIAVAPSLVGIGGSHPFFGCKKCRSKDSVCAKCSLKNLVGTVSKCCETNKAGCKLCVKSGKGCDSCSKSFFGSASLYGKYKPHPFPKLAFAPRAVAPAALAFPAFGDDGDNAARKLKVKLEKLERQIEHLSRQLKELGRDDGREPRRARRPRTPRAFVAPEPPSPPHAEHHERHRGHERHARVERERSRSHGRSMERKERKERKVRKKREHRKHAEHKLLKELKEHGHNRKLEGISGLKALERLYETKKHKEIKESRKRRAPRVWTESSDSSGDVVVKTYKIPDGKREALHTLMIRSDVPVRVKPTDDGIEVHGTPKQQRAFKAFLNIINPTSDGRSDATDSPSDSDVRDRREARAAVESAKSAYAQAVRLQTMSDEKQAMMAERVSLQYAAASEQMEAMTMRLAEETAVREAEAQEQMQEAQMLMQEQMEQAQEAQKLHVLESVLAALEAERDALETQLDAQREHADSVRSAADEMRSEADELRQEAKTLRDEAASANDASDGAAISAEAAGAMDRARELADAAKQLEAQVRELEAQTRAMEAKYRSFDEQVEAAERRRDAAGD